MNCISVCPSQTVIATIHPPLNVQASHNRLYNDRLREVRLAHNISENKVLKMGIYRLLPVNGPLGSFPE